MKIFCEIPYLASLEFVENRMQVVGPLSFLLKIEQLKNTQSADPRLWSEVAVNAGEDILINEFILKCQEKYKLCYNHEELCHCRMVPTEKVINVIKQGCFTTAEIARTTLAGTGCGSCKKDSEALVAELRKV